MVYFTQTLVKQGTMLAILRDVKMTGFQVLPWRSLQSSTESKRNTYTDNDINSLSLSLFVCVCEFICFHFWHKKKAAFLLSHLSES